MGFKNLWREGRGFIAVFPPTVSQLRAKCEECASAPGCHCCCLEKRLGNEGVILLTCACLSGGCMGRGGGLPKPPPPPPLPSHIRGDGEKPYLPTQYMAAYDPAHPFLSFQRVLLQSLGESQLRVVLPLGLWGKNSPECDDDDVIPAETIILVENSLTGPRFPAEARRPSRGKFKTWASCLFLLALEE